MLSRAVAKPSSNTLIIQTFVCTKYGTKYCRGPKVSNGKNVSSDKIIALPPRKTGPAITILFHFLPNRITAAAITKIVITTKSHNQPHEYIQP